MLSNQNETWRKQRKKDDDDDGCNTLSDKAHELIAYINDDLNMNHMAT